MALHWVALFTAPICLTQPLWFIIQKSVEFKLIARTWRRDKAFGQWERSFHMKAALKLVERLTTASGPTNAIIYAETRISSRCRHCRRWCFLSCHNDYIRYHHWRQNWHLDNSQFSVQRPSYLDKYCLYPLQSLLDSNSLRKSHYWHSALADTSWDTLFRRDKL